MRGGGEIFMSLVNESKGSWGQHERRGGAGGGMRGRGEGISVVELKLAGGIGNVAGGSSVWVLAQSR